MGDGLLQGDERAVQITRQPFQSTQDRESRCIGAQSHRAFQRCDRLVLPLLIQTDGRQQGQCGRIAPAHRIGSLGGLCRIVQPPPIGQNLRVDEAQPAIGRVPFQGGGQYGFGFGHAAQPPQCLRQALESRQVIGLRQQCGAKTHDHGRERLGVMRSAGGPDQGFKVWRGHEGAFGKGGWGLSK